MANLPLSSQLLRWSPLRRRLLLMGLDALLLPLAVWLSFGLRLAHPWSPQLQNCLWLLPAAPLLGLPLLATTGQYKGLTRYAGSQAFYRLVARNGLLVLLLAALGVLAALPMPPRSSWLLLWLLFCGFTGALRFALRDLLLSLQGQPRHQRQRVVIYGAGEAGAQLLASLRLARSHQVLAFVDDDAHLWHRNIGGVAIQPRQWLEAIAATTPIDQVLLAMPALSRSRRRAIVAALEPLGLPVLQVPSLAEITSGQARIDALRPVAIEELLGRDPVPPRPELLGPGIAGKVVLVTGAGGSIGSELCRLIMTLRPQRLVLLDNSEPSLYAIEQELRQHQHLGVLVLPVLADACDGRRLEAICTTHGVQVAFHAAAYKHVPLVELNPLAGLANNVFSTRALCQVALRCGFEQLTLISTDKAVRPTNVMGASKRLAELVVQAAAIEARARQLPTRLAMVRFGNVLGSSGSVVPLFRRQIAAGGPITLTHPEIIRYFMTIPEAAQLVLQAAVLAEGGDVFLLDMGEPVKILELARQMVRLSGLSLRDASNPDGDIEIVSTGLRPGEKLYEELLIDAQAQPTAHPLIFRAQERAIAPEQLWPALSRLDQALKLQQSDTALQTLAELVPEWSSALPQPNGHQQAAPQRSSPTETPPGQRPTAQPSQPPELINH